VEKTVTVDGILLSHREKQKYYASNPQPGVFSQLKSEYRFFKPYLKQLRQEEHDKLWGLVPYRSSGL
jgi:hypothetical protein